MSQISLLRSRLEIPEKSEAFRIMFDLGFEPDYSNPAICYGGKGSGSTNTTTSSSAPPADVTAAYDQALAQAQAASSAPLQQYQGQTVAPLNANENSAFGSLGNLSGVAQPFLNQASNSIAAGQTPLWNNVQQFSPDAVAQYQSPYTQQVLNTTMASQQNQDAQQQAALQGNAISSGAWGGDRAGVASAILSGQQDLANNATNANIENTGYNNALGEFNTQQQSQLGANEANAYLNEQAGFGQANLGSEALGTQTSAANAQLSAGQLQQQQTQSELNVPYEQFLQQQAYPFQTSQYYANIAEGLGSGQGGTSTTTTPAPSSTSQNVGLGIGSLGLLGSLFKQGGRVQPKRYGFGGSISDIPDLSISYIPSTTGTHGGGAGGPPQPPKPPVAQDDSKQDMANLQGFAKLAQQFKGALGSSGTSLSNSNIGGFGDVFGSGAGIDSGTGNSLATQNDINSSFLNPGDIGSSGLDFSGFGFKRGGRAGYKVGGDVLPILGDIGGAFFGDPMAGNQFQGITDLLGLHRGGRAGFDDGGPVGGPVGGVTPMGASSATDSPMQTNAQTNYGNMTQQQLQQTVMRLPAGSPQAKTATAVLQQKRMMPNVGVQAAGGFGSQQSQVPSTGTQPQMKRGGMAFADGGGIPDVPDQDQIAREMDVRNDVGADNSIPLIPDSALQPPSGGLGSSQMVASAEPPASAMGSIQPSNTASQKTDTDSDIQPKMSRRAPASANPWLALADAGFAMAAGNSHSAMQNIGAGAQAGLKNYATQQQEADSVNEASDKLMQEAKSHKDQIAIEQQNADTQKQNSQQTGAYQQGMLANQTATLKQKELLKDAFGNPLGWADPATGTITPIKGKAPAATAPLADTQSSATTGSMDPNVAALPDDTQATLSQISKDPKTQSLILGVAQGRIPPTKQYLGSNPQAYISAAAQLDPTFDVSNPTARMKTAADYSPAGKTGQQLTALENTSRHGAATALAALDLNNGTSSWNPLQTYMNQKENDYEAGQGDPRLPVYHSYLGNYGHEAMKVISGKTNPGEAETAEFMKPMDSSGAPGQILGALSAKNEMALAVAKDKQEAYDTAMGPYGQQKQLITPQAQQAFNDIDMLATAAKSGTLDSAPAVAAKQRLQTWAKPVMGKSGTVASSDTGGQSSAPAISPLAKAQAAIAAGADRGAVMQRLQAAGIDPSGLQ